LTAATNGRRPKQDLGPLKVRRERGPRSRAEFHHRLGPHAEGTTQGPSGIPWAEKRPAIRYCGSVAIRTLLAASGGGHRATGPDRTFCRLLGTTYSRSPSVAPPSTPAGRARTKAPACWGFRLVIDLMLLHQQGLVTTTAGWQGNVSEMGYSQVRARHDPSGSRLVSIARVRRARRSVVPRAMGPPKSRSARR